jgi:hypothetical protein
MVRYCDVGPSFRVELEPFLQRSKEPNALRVVLPDELLLQVPIVDGSNELSGGWLLINIEQYELPVEPPAFLNSRKWA